MRELLSNNSLFGGQLFEDKSLSLRARDLIFDLLYTTDLQTVNYYSTIHTARADLFLKSRTTVEGLNLYKTIGNTFA